MMFYVYLAVGIYVLIVVGMSLLQRRLMYLPDTKLDAPAVYGLNDFMAIRLIAADNVRITGWYHPARPGMPTLIYFHGNAGNLSMRAARYQHFAEAGLGVIALSWRGYGNSGGSPSELGLYEDARTTIRYATGTLRVKPEQLILYGESLGSGVAVQMATEYPIGMLVLEAPYTSVVNRAAEIYRFLPVKWILKDRYDSISKIKDVHAPLLLFHCEDDKVIPISHGKALYAAANEPKKSIYYSGYHHVDYPAADVTRELLSFAHEVEFIK